MFLSQRVRLARACIGRYPAAWRDRYEAELLALIDDVPPRWRDVWDLWRGSVVERMRALVEPASYPQLAAAAVLAVRHVVVPVVVTVAALAVGWTLERLVGPLSDDAVDAAAYTWLAIFAGLIVAYVWRAVRRSRRGEKRWSLGTADTLIWLIFVSNMLVLGAWATEPLTGMQLLIWFYNVAWSTSFVLKRWRKRPGQPLVDAVNALLVAREQMSWARMELTRCQTLAAQGAPIAADLARAEAELSRWQAQHEEATRTLRSMGYRARLARAHVPESAAAQ